MPSVSATTLNQLFAANAFPVPTAELVPFGLRGALPRDEEAGLMARAHRVDLAAVDYVHPRCTLGLWDTGSGEVALFPGTTVPHIRYVTSARSRGGRGANELLCGRYEGYAKGTHRAGSSTGHRALRQTKAQGHRRTTDDLDFDGDDRVEVGVPFDNIHAMWSMGPDHAYFASAGCQGACGYPRCTKRGDRSATGPWAQFDAAVWASEQELFTYHLLPARELLRVADLNVPRTGVSLRLRFGSEGDAVGLAQIALSERGHYGGAVDDAFGPLMLRAVLDFQEEHFGPDADDGVIGPITAGALGVTLPTLR